MASLIDTNVIIRFLIADDETQFAESKTIFTRIESGELEVVIPDCVILECLYVLIRFYKLPKNEVINDLKVILSLDGVINNDKYILFEALNIFKHKSMDFTDALICAKSLLQNYGVISFDKDLKKCS